MANKGTYGGATLGSRIRPRHGSGTTGGVVIGSRIRPRIV